MSKSTKVMFTLCVDSDNGRVTTELEMRRFLHDHAATLAAMGIHVREVHTEKNIFESDES